ncbi:uncharacterized protein LOC129600458 isoform X2 [Paramacrobiotus metropolitanus]|uniref:uncharacterized protein LOC129600458 isoform X2 n=1 Tax=Paramacrobiotus metropolitanus TaxID=2943436 RepID=UPI00244569C8|nr:uncharacterized protein LOC129600458 isoform X2 [Paramacrobiotus metropolitanus]
MISCGGVTQNNYIAWFVCFLLLWTSCYCSNLTALQEAVNSQPSEFAYYNCSATDIYHAESDGNMCFCRSVYDLREFNVSTWDLDIFAEYEYEELQPYLQQTEPFAAYVDYISCRFAHGPCECPFTKSAVQMRNGRTKVAPVS